MKKIIIKKIEVKNFKAIASQVIEVPPGGITISGHNGSGKSSILEAVVFCLGCNVESARVLNQTTKAPASASLTVEHPEGVDTYTRTLTPTLDASGKVTASTSTYVISGVPVKKGLYDSRIAGLFNTKDWHYLLRPELNALNKDARNILLEVSGAPSEAEFLGKNNPQLASVIGSTSFNDFESREKRIIQDLGRKVDSIPGRIEENAAMLQEVPESADEASVDARLEEIKAELAKVDSENTSCADQYNKVAGEAQSLRTEAQKLRTLAADKVAEANKEVEEAEQLVYEWNRTRTDLSRQLNQIRGEIGQVRQDQANKERQIAETAANIQAIANECREISARVPSADGQCSVCGVYCAQLQAKGIEAAIAANAQELDRTKQEGREAVALRDKMQTDLETINKKIDALMCQEHEIESLINALGEAPTVPQRAIIEATPESLHLAKQAQDLENTAEKLIKSNRLEVAQYPEELVKEFRTLNEKRTANTNAKKNNDRVNARIEELRTEESKLLIKQLQHKQLLAQLADFHRNYASTVTDSANKLFDGTPYSIKLFDANMSNERGVPVMQPMVKESNNLSTAENLVFWKLFAERVLSVKYDTSAPMLIDNTECLDSAEKLRSTHQVFAARVARQELAIENI